MRMSNQDVINFLNQVRKMLLDDRSWLESTIQPINEAFDMAISALKKQTLPSAQPETAKRIVGKSRNGMTLWYQCDMCNEPVDAQDNFCRGCGRRLTDG